LTELLDVPSVWVGRIEKPHTARAGLAGTLLCFYQKVLLRTVTVQLFNHF
jgi:hypothetical protein